MVCLAPAEGAYGGRVRWPHLGPIPTCPCPSVLSTNVSAVSRAPLAIAYRLANAMFVFYVRFLAVMLRARDGLRTSWSPVAWASLIGETRSRISPGGIIRAGR